MRTLKAEIADLKAQREPLLLPSGSFGRINPRCTGSMGPALTCLDKATVLMDFRPEVIVVGAIITFHRCDDRLVAHRVVDVRIEDGVRMFQTQGDASPEPDECWISETDVDSYVTAIHKNIRPDNAPLRDAVRGARADFEASVDAYRTARATYRDLVERVCGDRYAASCNFGSHLNEARELYARSRALYDAHLVAFETYNCWLQNAREAEYDGHITHECAA